ncbi:MAG TPA: phosphoribosyltransferase family protein [Ktedonobacterales bacterium]|nr:phosphoribosyltransferase family protein [Ktedonobacterales bacterium]
MNNQPLDTLWLARAIFDLGGVTFGDYTLGGSTVNSPVYINPRALISNPEALRVAARLMAQEVTLAQSLRRAHAQPYDVVAGVPTGGLLLAAAFALESNTPLIYARLRQEGTGQRGIEGRYMKGARALLIDDLVTGGASMSEMARFLAEHDIKVHDAVALVDRQMGARTRLKRVGINLISILKLDVMMNHYYESSLITEDQHNAYLNYVRANRAAEMEELDVSASGEHRRQAQKNDNASNGHDAEHESDAH